MKIYKLDIDTSKPIRKVVQMQQNATGALSVDVSNDGWPIRNLSCALYDGETQLSAYAELSSGAGYKIDIGDTPKVVKFTAKSTPITSTEKYLVNAGTGRVKQTFCAAIQIPAGTYRQDEFLLLVPKFSKTEVEYGEIVTPTIFTGTNISSKANFDRLLIIGWNPLQQVFFQKSDGSILPQDELIVVTEDIELGKNVAHNQTGAQFATRDYPSIGYWTDYSLDTVIRPSENAHCYAEQEVTGAEDE